MGSDEDKMHYGWYSKKAAEHCNVVEYVMPDGKVSLCTCVSIYPNCDYRWDDAVSLGPVGRFSRVVQYGNLRDDPAMRRFYQ